MGGRGASSSNSTKDVPLHGASKSVKKKYKTLGDNIKEHAEKIERAKRSGIGLEDINHWQVEINAWVEQRRNIERRYGK